MPVTIHDVAAQAGVHVSTVSRAFTQPQRLSIATRDRVLATAASLGYRPSRLAQALITGRTGNVGIIVPDIANPFFASLIKACQERARKSDYAVFVADTDEDPELEEELVGAVAKQVDGVVLASTRLRDEVVVRLRQSTPLVLVNRKVGDVRSVVMDVGAGMAEAVEHLAGLGHRDIVHVSGPAASWTAEQVKSALTKVTAARKIRLREVGPFHPTFDGGHEAGAAVAAAARDGATAVIAYNDLICLGLLHVLPRLGLRIPDDLSLVGVDDVPAARFAAPPLTTLAMPTYQAGLTAFDALQAVLDPSAGIEPLASLPVSLIVRESTTRARS